MASIIRKRLRGFLNKKVDFFLIYINNFINFAHVKQN